MIDHFSRCMSSFLHTWQINRFESFSPNQINKSPIRSDIDLTLDFRLGALPTIKSHIFSQINLAYPLEICGMYTNYVSVRLFHSLCCYFLSGPVMHHGLGHNSAIKHFDRPQNWNIEIPSPKIKHERSQKVKSACMCSKERKVKIKI